MVSAILMELVFLLRWQLVCQKASPCRQWADFKGWPCRIEKAFHQFWRVLAFTEGTARLIKEMPGDTGITSRFIRMMGSLPENIIVQRPHELTPGGWFPLRRGCPQHHDIWFRRVFSPAKCGVANFDVACLLRYSNGYQTILIDNKLKNWE